MLLLKIKRFLTDEDGPTAVEYAVMLALVIVVCLVSVQALGSATNVSFSNLADSLDSFN
jgi:pilus assembly protein Flp/PilA